MLYRTSKWNLSGRYTFLRTFSALDVTWLSVFPWLHYCRHSSALMCCWTVWLKILNSASLPHYKLLCQEITFTGMCESVWCVRMFVLNLGDEVVVVVWACAGWMCGLRWLCACSLCWHGVFWCLLAVHSVVKKVAQYMADVLEDSRDKVQENLLANGGTVMVTTQCVPIILVLTKSSD